MAMVSMKMDPKEAKSEGLCCEPCDGPEYPYGLCIDLNNEALAKLGIKTLPPVGMIVTIQAKATVTSTSSNSRQGGEQEMRASLQITDLDVAQDDGKSAAQKLYAASDMAP